MIKHHAKQISNMIKICIVIFIFFNYMYQSKVQGKPMTADECRGLLYIAIAGFCILFPIDASIFIRNFNETKNIKLGDTKDKEINDENS